MLTSLVLSCMAKKLLCYRVLRMRSDAIVFGLYVHFLSCLVYTLSCYSVWRINPHATVFGV